MPLHAGLELPKVFTPHMVLQRGMAVPVYAAAAPGETVAVKSRDLTKSATSGQVGKWCVKLDALAAGGPDVLTIGDKIIEDVLVGDVWIGSGQSNTDMPVSAYAGDDPAPAAAAKEHYPKIRLMSRLWRQGCAVGPGREPLWAIIMMPATGRGAVGPSPVPGNEARWFKGNLHTHSLWSDGDDYPEMIADWYKRNGYQFLGISDHNVLQQGQRWLELKPPAEGKSATPQNGGGVALEQYLGRFGPDWVEQRESSGKTAIRLKPLAEYRSLLEEPGRFLMISSEEITSSWKRPKTETAPAAGGPVHMNVTNPRDFIPPVGGDSALSVMQRTIDAVLAQRAKTGQPMFPHLNHPNFGWGVTAEELMQLRGEQFFEIYNGHPGVHNDGDATHLGTDEMWDAILTRRIAELHLPLMFCMAVDDAHAYHGMKLGQSNPGRGWVMVRAKNLTAESIITAMEAGDFYASSGVTLADVKRGGNQLEVEIHAEPGVTYLTKFIGTRIGYDAASQLLLRPEGEAAGATVPHRRYSKEVGAVLAEVPGSHASYTMHGDELYVRAKIISSKPKPNASVAKEVECAWTQPLAGTAK